MSFFQETINFYRSNSYNLLDKYFVYLYFHHREQYYLARFVSFLVWFIVIHCYRLSHKKAPDYWTSPFFNKPIVFFLTSLFLAIIVFCAVNALAHDTFIFYLDMYRKRGKFY